MSNAAVGQVYDHIISEVINAVRVDFEENGVDDGVLEELKKVRKTNFPSLDPSCIYPSIIFPIVAIRNPSASLFIPLQSALLFSKMHAFSR